MLQLPFSAPLRPSADKKGVAVAADKKMLQLPFSVSLRVARCCSCSSSRPFAPLRGHVDIKGWPVLQFFATLRAPSQLPFSVVLRGPSRTKRCCSCSSSRPFAALRGQKGVAVAVLRDPSCPFVDKKVLQLQFFATLRVLRGQKGVAVAVLRDPSRGPSRTKDVAVAVLRGPPWPFVDKRCCRCPSPRLREKPPPPSH